MLLSACLYAIWANKQLNFKNMFSQESIFADFLKRPLAKPPSVQMLAKDALREKIDLWVFPKVWK